MPFRALLKFCAPRECTVGEAQTVSSTFPRGDPILVDHYSSYTAPQFAKAFSFIPSLGLLNNHQHYVKAVSTPNKVRYVSPREAGCLPKPIQVGEEVGQSSISGIFTQFFFFFTSFGVFLSFLLSLRVLRMRKMNP